MQGVPVAVEAERDTGADEGHPLLVAPANKSSHADRQVRSAERTRTPSAYKTERLKPGCRRKDPGSPLPWGRGDHPATSSGLST